MCPESDKKQSERNCINPTPRNGGKPCAGFSEKTDEGDTEFCKGKNSLTS